SMAVSTVSESAENTDLGGEIWSVHIPNLVVHGAESFDESLRSLLGLDITGSGIGLERLQDGGLHVAECSLDGKFLGEILLTLTIFVYRSVCLVEEFESGKSTLDLGVEVEGCLDVTANGDERKGEEKKERGHPGMK
ncbi:hypothetical protein PFISCL1PPCAC_16105, partial [Pristionchus fissidentatus]